MGRICVRQTKHSCPLAIGENSADRPRCFSLLPILSAGASADVTLDVWHIPRPNGGRPSCHTQNPTRKTTNLPGSHNKGVRVARAGYHRRAALGTLGDAQNNDGDTRKWSRPTVSHVAHYLLIANNTNRNIVSSSGRRRQRPPRPRGELPEICSFAFPGNPTIVKL